MSGQPDIPSSIPPMAPDRPRAECTVPREFRLIFQDSGAHRRLACTARERSKRYR